MASVVRLKRYLSEEPSETLVINCKRLKTDKNSDNDPSELSALFTFAGTIRNQDKDIVSHIKKTTSAKKAPNYERKLDEFNCQHDGHKCPQNIKIMASVVRLKRYLSEEPSETLVINCKRLRTDKNSENNPSELSALFTFAGTIKNQDEDIVSHIKKTTSATKTDLEEQFKKRNIDINSKLRTQKQEDSKHSRYKIINCFRSHDLSTKSVDDTEVTEFTVYDLESENCKDTHETTTKPTDYVYDLYYTTSDDFGDAQLSDTISIYPLSDDLVFGSARDNGYNDNDDDYDSDDSNAENYWRNDYPDEDEDGCDSVTEDDMINAMERCDLSDLSSDDGEESFVYGKDHYDDGDGEDDDTEQRRYGERFAKFMSKHQKLEKVTSGGLYYGDIADNDEDEDDEYPTD